MTTFAVVVPVGPGRLEVERLRDLVASVVHYEPSVRHLVVIDDAVPLRRLASLIDVPSSCEVIVLSNPRNGAGHGTLGGLAVGILSSLAWLRRHAAPDFV